MDNRQMGQLIAEIAKFGGWDKQKASQLARILLPHIRATNVQVVSAVRQKLADMGFDSNETCMEVIDNELVNLQEEANDHQ